jgi:GrpB-like predicted nucleotidyltransferase (UPF0157 family)
MHVAEALSDAAPSVEPIGSSSVVGLLAKPIVDLAVGQAPEQDLGALQRRLEVDGWIYRGDAGSEGGHVFVLQDRPWHRVAHLHVVAVASGEWRDYLRLRDLLRESSQARERYAAVKRRLLASGVGRAGYTTGKSEIVRSLLDGRSAREWFGHCRKRWSWLAAVRHARSPVHEGER